MIIVKTKDGCRFINDKAFAMVEYIRERTCVNCFGDKGLLLHIEAVEGVVYASDAHPTLWEDAGSETRRMKKALNEKTEQINRLRDEYLRVEQERDELRGRIASLEPKADPDRWWPNDVDAAPVNVITGYIGKHGWDPGYGVRLGKIFDANGIRTVGDLLRIGRRDFRKYRSVGGGSITRIDDALEGLFGIGGW